MSVAAVELPISFDLPPLEQQQIPLDIVRRNAGRTAFEIASILPSCANFSGRTHVTLKGIQRKLSRRGHRFTQRKIRYGLRRLCSLNLLVNIGRTELGVPNPAYTTGHSPYPIKDEEVFERLTNYEIVPREGTTHFNQQYAFSTTKETAELVEAANGWGGRRPGAGGRKKDVVKPATLERYASRERKKQREEAERKQRELREILEQKFREDIQTTCREMTLEFLNLPPNASDYQIRTKAESQIPIFTRLALVYDAYYTGLEHAQTYIEHTKFNPVTCRNDVVIPPWIRDVSSENHTSQSVQFTRSGTPRKYKADRSSESLYIRSRDGVPKFSPRPPSGDSKRTDRPGPGRSSNFFRRRDEGMKYDWEDRLYWVSPRHSGIAPASREQIQSPRLPSGGSDVQGQDPKVPAPPAGVTPVTPQLDYLPDSPLGSVLRPARRRGGPIDVDRILAIIPPRPTATHLPPVMRPRAPNLPRDLSDAEMVRRLIMAYRGGVEARFKIKSYVFATGDVTKSKHYPVILAGAEELRARRISPVLWVEFRFHMWREWAHTSSTRLPSVAWVFQADAVEKWSGWFHDKWDRKHDLYCMTEKHKLLTDLWAQMYSEAHRLGAEDTDDEIIDLVERYFPGNSWNEALREIRSENERQQEEVNRRVAAGEWFWR